MRVLVISTVRFRTNGITSVIMNYYRNMDRQKIQMDFVVINEIPDPLRTELEAAGAGIFRLPRKENPPAYRRGLYRLMRENQYDIVHIHGNSAMMALETWTAKRAGIPVRIAHSHNTTCTHPRLHRILYPLFARTYTHGLACGEEAGRWLFRDAPFEVIKNGIDLGRFGYSESVRARYREKTGAGDRTVIGHVGNFIGQKNHEFLIRVFEKLLREEPGYLLLLIGDGQLMDAVRHQVRELGLDDSVLFLGKTMEVEKYLQAMDIFVLPSRYEGLPVVLVEAQAAGLPCLVSDVVTDAADLTGQVKFLPGGDVDGWTDAIRRTRAGAEDRECVSGQARERITGAGYDIAENACRLNERYEQYRKEAGGYGSLGNRPA